MKVLATLFATTLFLCALALPVRADEGLWPYSQFPKDTVKDKYKAEVSQEFLDNLRLATVGIGGGSGSFVSATGLIVTNQHLVAKCVAKAGPNAARDGFNASTQAAESKCEGLTAQVLTSVEDVTTKVRGTTTDKTPATQALQQRNAAAAQLEKACPAAEKCSVVKLFSGGRYDLYHFKVYSDIRLVFAPEYQIAFFGGNRDSITYLRYGLELAFVRAYENNRPAATPHFLKWSAEGAKDGDFVLSSGTPQPTLRLSSAAQLNFLRDSSLPYKVNRLQSRIQAMSAFMAKSEQNRLAAEPVFNEVLADYKTSAGRLIGLRDDRLVTRKSSFEKKIRQSAERATGSLDPKVIAEAGKVWDDIQLAYKTWQPSEKAYQALEASPAPGSVLFAVARQLIRNPSAGVREETLPDELEITLLTQYFEELVKLGEQNAPGKAILGGKTAAQAAEAAVQATKLKDLAERRRLAASPDAVKSSDDPIIKLVLAIEPTAQKLRKKHEDQIEALDASAADKIAQYRLKLFGAAEYPDATSTPRLEFGVVKGYTDRADVVQPYADTISGLYYRRNNEGPYMVPARWVDLRDKLNLITNLNFVSTIDVGGGDFGGPVVNQAGELVGVTFDGNLESLPNTYLYSDEQSRAVHVATPGIVELLDKAYHADALLKELGAKQ